MGSVSAFHSSRAVRFSADFRLTFECFSTDLVHFDAEGDSVAIGGSGGGSSAEDGGGESVKLLMSDANVQVNGKGGFQAAFMELKGELLTFRDKQGGKEIGLGSVVGAEARKPKNPRKGHPHSFRLDLTSPDTRGVSKYIISVDTEAAATDWIAGIQRAGVSEAVPPTGGDPASGGSADLAGGEMVTVEALQRADSHLQRTHGHTRVQGVGTYVVRWGNALFVTKTRGRTLRYAVWLQRVSKSGGRSAKVPCTINLRQLNSKHTDSPATKAASGSTTAKERRRQISLEQIQVTPEALQHSARKLDDVQRSVFNGRILISY